MKNGEARVRVRLDDRSYTVSIAPGLLGRVGPRLRRLGHGGRVAIVTQETPGSLYAGRLAGSLREAGFRPCLVTIPEGEGAKTIEEAMGLYRFFMSEGLDRWSPVIALGGGVVGDLAGFAAGTFMRGLPFFQVPTTLISQVDSSVGGKVAVNLPEAKNLVGLLHQPGAVFIDTDTLGSLPVRDLRAGFAEVIRYAAVADRRFFGFLERNLDRILRRDTGLLGETIRRCCAIKARLVERDERDLEDVRALLNYGHTVGHALESSAGYGAYRHGEAVAVGMAVAARLSRLLGICSQEETERQINLIGNAGLPVTLRGVSAETVHNHLKLDKKTKQGRLRFVLTERIGRASVCDGVDMADVARALTAS